MPDLEKLVHYNTLCQVAERALTYHLTKKEVLFWNKVRNDAQMECEEIVKEGMKDC